jgi:shikimate dehydrogenase
MAIPYAEVIGDPIGHSKSPLIHKFWLEKLEVRADYRAVRVTPANLAEYLSDRRNDPDWRGCNVTMPLKAQVVPHLSELDGEAKRLRAVNCVGRRGKRLWGTNFDSTAVIELLAPLPRGAHATLLGSGGAARAALWALPLAGSERITVQARDPAKAWEMIESLRIAAEAARLGSPIQDRHLSTPPPWEWRVTRRWTSALTPWPMAPPCSTCV